MDNEIIKTYTIEAGASSNSVRAIEGRTASENNSCGFVVECASNKKKREKNGEKNSKAHKNNNGVNKQTLMLCTSAFTLHCDSRFPRIDIRCWRFPLSNTQ